ncbi:universal stress protein [uncultured Algibacter sp.]|uniref:universal stress protein n=1 Tax=uncultured Algibacter sp. TaxID=298659 RepID=UPI0032170A61
MINTILVPIDFSEHSEYALHTAAILAKKYSAKIVALHMMGISEAVLNKSNSQGALEGIFHVKLAEKQFEDFLNKEYLKDINLQTTVINHTHFDEIDGVAKDFDANLIIMGSHGSSGVKEVFVGSNTEKVVRTSEIPVLVVKQPVHDFKMRKVVFACDFNLDFIEPFKKAWGFFKKIDVDMQIVYVNMPDQFLSTQEMKSKAFKFFVHAGINDVEGHHNVIYYNDYKLENGIFNFSKAFYADLVVIPTHGRSGLSHFFSENIGESLVNHGSMPMMTFKV